MKFITIKWSNSNDAEQKKPKIFNLYSICDAFRPKQMHDLTKKQTANKNDSLKAHVAKYHLFFSNSPTYKKKTWMMIFTFFLKNRKIQKKMNLCPQQSVCYFYRESFTSPWSISLHPIVIPKNLLCTKKSIIIIY